MLCCAVLCCHVMMCWSVKSFIFDFFRPYRPPPCGIRVSYRPLYRPLPSPTVPFTVPMTGGKTGFALCGSKAGGFSVPM